MPNRSGMIVFDGIGPTANYMFLNVATQIYEAMEEGAREVQAFAQGNAFWSDITGMARAGLTAEVSMDGTGEVVIDLSHSVDYGQWLELIQDGNFAIIMPTIETLGPEILARAGAAATSIRGGGSIL